MNKRIPFSEKGYEVLYIQCIGPMIYHQQRAVFCEALLSRPEYIDVNLELKEVLLYNLIYLALLIYRSYSVIMSLVKDQHIDEIKFSSKADADYIRNSIAHFDKEVLQQIRLEKIETVKFDSASLYNASDEVYKAYISIGSCDKVKKNNGREFKPSTKNIDGDPFRILDYVNQIRTHKEYYRLREIVSKNTCSLVYVTDGRIEILKNIPQEKYAEFTKVLENF